MIIYETNKYSSDVPKTRKLLLDFIKKDEHIYIPFEIPEKQNTLKADYIYRAFLLYEFLNFQFMLSSKKQTSHLFNRILKHQKKLSNIIKSEIYKKGENHE